MAKVDVQKTVTLTPSEVQEAINIYLVKKKYISSKDVTTITVKMQENELIATIEITE